MKDEENGSPWLLLWLLGFSGTGWNLLESRWWGVSGVGKAGYPVI